MRCVGGRRNRSDLPHLSRGLLRERKRQYAVGGDAVPDDFVRDACVDHGRSCSAPELHELSYTFVLDALRYFDAYVYRIWACTLSEASMRTTSRSVITPEGTRGREWRSAALTAASSLASSKAARTPTTLSSLRGSPRSPVETRAPSIAAIETAAWASGTGHPRSLKTSYPNSQRETAQREATDLVTRIAVWKRSCDVGNVAFVVSLTYEDFDRTGALPTSRDHMCRKRCSTLHC